LSAEGHNAAQAVEMFVVAFVNFAYGGAMVFLDPEAMPPQYRRALTWFTKTERGRKRLGWVLMAVAVMLVATECGDLMLS
jgi:hypothetical protein